MSDSKTVEQFDRECAQKRLRTNAVDLRDLADTFDRIADEMDRVGTPGRPNYTQIAGQAIQAHATWLMNAHLGAAMQFAAEADVARAKGE